MAPRLSHHNIRWENIYIFLRIFFYFWEYLDSGVNSTETIASQYCMRKHLHFSENIFFYFWEYLDSGVNGTETIASQY